MARFAPLSVAAAALAGVLTLSSCSVIDQLVGETPDVAQVEEASEVDEVDSVDEAPVEETPEVVAEEDVVPDCDTMYSDGIVAAFADEGRELNTQNPSGGYGWGSVNQDLVSILEDVRTDLAVSCTWYLPASESGSTTTVAIIASELVPDIESALRANDGTSEPLGEGELWKLDQTSSNISGEFDANETHFLVSTPCPASLAEPECTLWIASTFSFGSSERLTRDAAEVLGKL
jgi:hypothetical protein